MVPGAPTPRPLMGVLLGTHNIISLSNPRKVLENGDTGQMTNCPKKSHFLFKISHISFLFLTLHMHMVLHFTKYYFPVLQK